MAEDNIQIDDLELRSMANEIEADLESGQIQRAQLLQSLYMDRVWEKRQLTCEALVEECQKYLGDPAVAREYPSLMNASDGDLNNAAKYVIWFMLAGAADGYSFGIRFTCGEVEKAFASMTILNGEERFR